MDYAKSVMGLGLTLALLACSPTQFTTGGDLSSQVKVRAAGFTPTQGRVNLDCFTTQVNGNEFNQGQRPTSLGLPMNCPNSVQGGEAGAVSKFDVSVVLDASENMLPVAAGVKTQLVQLLTKLNTEGFIGTLSATTFRNALVANVVNGETAKIISDIAGNEPDWNPNALKTIDPNSTDWVTNDAAKAVFAGIEEGIKHLKSGSHSNKILIVISASTGKGSAGKEVGPTARVVSEYASQVASGGGQLIFNYAANKDIARGLSSYDPTAIEQLDLLASSAGIKPLRALIPSDLANWVPSTVNRALVPAAHSEACPLTGFVATDASGQTIFKKDVASADLNGTFEASIPASVPNGTLTLSITRSCARSGERSQSISLTLSGGGTAK